jgi:hypothetical protein
MTSVTNAIIEGLAERKAGGAQDGSEDTEAVTVETKAPRKRAAAVAAPVSSEEE